MTPMKAIAFIVSGSSTPGPPLAPITIAHDLTKTMVWVS
jgi:hypothetical protein